MSTIWDPKGDGENQGFFSRLYSGIFNHWSSALREKDFAAITDWFNTWFFAIGILGLLLAWLAAYADRGPRVGYRVFALGLLLAGACGMTGWLFGLLFGIPRSLARGGQAVSAPAKPGAPAPSSKVNTNLEDVSDWLTKTLIGVSLTQLTAFPKFLGDLASMANAYGFDWTEAANPRRVVGAALAGPGVLLAESIIIYFTAGGFWLGYVGTRTVLTSLFESIESGLSQADLDTAKSAMNLKITEVNLGTHGILQSDPAVAFSDLKLLAIPITVLASLPDVVAWSAAQARAGHLEAAQVALEGALGSDTANVDVRRVLATVYAARNKFGEANDLLRSLPPSRTTLFCALYENPPTGFERAIQVGTLLIADTACANDVDVRVWLTCAYGQKYAFEAGKAPVDPGLLADLKARVIENAKAAIRIDPGSRDILLAFWKPVPNSRENDLSGLPSDDPDLTALLQPRA